MQYQQKRSRLQTFDRVRYYIKKTMDIKKQVKAFMRALLGMIIKLILEALLSYIMFDVLFS